MASKTRTKSSNEDGERILAFLCYLLWPVGLVLLLLNKQEGNLRYHAWNGIGLAVVWMVLAWLLGWILWMLWPLSQIVWIAGLIYAILLGSKAYNGEKPEIPVISGIVRQNVKGV
jgi:uncharacterized membrane protein